MAKRILIVDDEKNMRNAIKRNLGLEDEYEFAEAWNGKVAEEKMEDFSPDLIILDIKMPEKDGYTFFLDLQMKNNYRIKPKIVGITGYSGKVGANIMKALGADAFFEKPFDEEKFRRTIRRLCNKVNNG